MLIKSTLRTEKKISIKREKFTKKYFKIHKKYLHCDEIKHQSVRLTWAIRLFIRVGRGSTKEIRKSPIDPFQNRSKRRRTFVHHRSLVKIMKCTATKWVDACVCVRNAARLLVYIMPDPGKWDTIESSTVKQARVSVRFERHETPHIRPSRRPRRGHSSALCR